MADLTFNIDDVKKIVDPALADAITTMTTAFKNAKDGVIKYAEAVKLLGQEVADKIKAAAESAKSFAEASKDMSLEKLTSSFGDVGSAVGTLLYNIEPFIHVLPAAKDSIASFAKEATNVDVLTASFGKLDNALQAPLAKLSLGFFGDSTKLENGVKIFLAQADAANNFEKGILSLAASTGQLNDIESEGLDIGKTLAAESTKMVGLTYNVANATGLTMTQTLAYANALGHIPGALSETIHLQSMTADSMTELEATMKLSSAYGVEYTKTVESLNKMYLNFRTPAQDAVEALSGIYEAAQKTHMPLENVKSTVEGIATSFAMFGDNTKAATAILETFGESLKGVGATQIDKIVQDMAAGIGKMNEGQKAFISAQSGGPGGLAGAFQIDYALQQGNMNEVLSKTMQAMQRQFNAPVVTLEDVNKNQSLAPELMKQVSYLKDVAGIATSNQEAYRILEAMKTGNVQDIKKESDQVQLTHAVESGTKIQERSANELTRVANATEYMAMTQAQLFAKELHDNLGVDRGKMEESSRKALGLGTFQKSSYQGEDMRTIQTDMNDVLDNMGNFIGRGKSFFGSFNPASTGGGGTHPTSGTHLAPVAPPAYHPNLPGAGGTPAHSVVEVKPTPLNIHLTVDIDKAHHEQVIDARIDWHEQKNSEKLNNGGSVHI